MLQHYSYLSHVISQLSYKWFPTLACVAIKMPPLAEMRQRDWQRLLNETRDQWACCLPHSVRCRLLRSNGELIARAALENYQLVRADGAGLIFIDDEDYPNWLKQIPDAPLCLTYIGNREVFTYSKVSVIGSRRASGHGLKESYRLGTALANRGIAVVSGGALGCDIASHQGVIDTKVQPLPAICILSGGLHGFYPKRNHIYFDGIIKGGGLIASERLWWSKSRPVDFRARNRIIAGLSPLTAVMQAGERSGALITAMYALDQGRELICLEHEHDDVKSLGSQMLIDQGAPSFGSAEQIANILDTYKPNPPALNLQESESSVFSP